MWLEPGKHKSGGVLETYPGGLLLRLEGSGVFFHRQIAYYLL
jgi:hypothetical protein